MHAILCRVEHDGSAARTSAKRALKSARFHCTYLFISSAPAPYMDWLAGA
jgi:hypothetical protein